MTPELLQANAAPIGLGLAVIIILAFGPLRTAVLASFEQGHERGKRARRTVAPAPTANNTVRPSPKPASFGRR
jgi:hypothetical protein